MTNYCTHKLMITPIIPIIWLTIISHNRISRHYYNYCYCFLCIETPMTRDFPYWNIVSFHSKSVALRELVRLLPEMCMVFNLEANWFQIFMMNHSLLEVQAKLLLGKIIKSEKFNWLLLIGAQRWGVSYKWALLLECWLSESLKSTQ